MTLTANQDEMDQRLSENHQWATLLPPAPEPHTDSMYPTSRRNAGPT